MIVNQFSLAVPGKQYTIGPFGTVSDTDFVAIIQAAHNGEIDLQQDCGWSVGNTRLISISAFTGGGDVSHAAQNIDIAISSFANYENCGCVMQFDFVEELASGNRMNATSFNNTGYGNSEMKTTTLPALVNALPSYLRGLLIEFSCKAASSGYSGATIQTITGNKLALRSEVEVFGKATNSLTGQGSQVPYYQTASNRIKKRGRSGSNGHWWLRSPHKTSSSGFCLVYSDGTSQRPAYITNADRPNGVAPFGCI